MGYIELAAMVELAANSLHELAANSLHELPVDPAACVR
jgi:hypothetical protein